MGVSPVNMAQTLATIDAAIAAGDRVYVCCAAVHSVLDAHRDPKLREIFNRSLLTTPDGMPLVWLCRRAGHSDADRVYGPDLMLSLAEHSLAHGYRHFFLGSQPRIVEALTARLVTSFPGFSVAGWLCPDYPGSAPAVPDPGAVNAIRATKPDVVWVALGTGKQEQWMDVHAGELDVPVMIGVGVAFDYLAGAKRQAPAWVRQAGLEWLFRLVTEPTRLWRRYVEYPRFVWLLFLQMARLRNFRLD
jgi:N-acetylglucosaminyldiphosphoundecaprenol N-acetyl-beta-D-mannosaminyltransferase